LKRIVLLFALLAVLLAACGGAASTAPGAPARTSTATLIPAQASTLPPQATATAQPTPTPIPGGCQVVSLLPAGDPTFPPVTAADWTRGPADAAVTILEYSDFQCPYCAQLEPILSKLGDAFPNDLRVVFRHFPLNIHDKSILAAQAAEAAGLQGKFWEMNAFLMDKQADWETRTPADFETWVTGQAASLGLDAAKFTADLKSPAVIQKVQDALKSADAIGLDHTPFVILNGRALGQNTNPDEPTLTYFINFYKQLNVIKPKLSSTCPEMTIDKTRQYIATLTTSKGDIVIQLYPDKAPLAVNSFVYLANKGWFDNVPFHRVIQDFVAQTGDPSGTGVGNPGYNFNNEIVPGLKFDKEGVVGMANSGANTNGSQFFITLAAEPHLDGGYTVFGQVIDGMLVVKQLTVRDPSQEANPASPDMILSVKVEVK
jgi:cyclophilin family peptidyl-prolyl cis-trans isomerase/protein-disulfide isomerase